MTRKCIDTANGHVCSSDDADVFSQIIKSFKSWQSLPWSQSSWDWGQSLQVGLKGQGFVMKLWLCQTQHVCCLLVAVSANVRHLPAGD